MKALALILIFIPSIVQANQCLEIFKGSRLTNSQNYWLDIAQSTDYSVTKLIAPDGKNVIIMGETHLKDVIASVVGRRVLLEFPHRAHELASSEKTWGGEFFSLYLETVFNHIQTTTNRTYQSTISDAHSTAAEVLSSVRALESTLAKTLNVEVQAVQQNSSLNRDYTNYKNFFLENNHRPDLKENLYSVVVPTEYLSKALLIPTAAFSLAAPNGFVAEIVLPTLLVIVGTRAIHKYLGKKLKTKYSDKTWFNNIFFDDRGLLDARNKTKTKNINKILNENPEVKTLLVIVGKLHVEGIVENLLNVGYHKELK